MLSTMGQQKSFQNKLGIETIDLHIHTDFSDGRCGFNSVLSFAKARGLKLIAITDHFSELPILPRRMDESKIKHYLESLSYFRVLKGVEVDIFSGGPSISKKNSKLFDLILGGLHKVDDIILGEFRPKIVDVPFFVEKVRILLIKALESDLIDVLVHPFWFPENVRSEANKLMTKDWIDSVLDVASDNNVALEVNGSWRVPNKYVVGECTRQGIKLSIGSDAHSRFQIGNTSYSVRLLKELDTPSEALFYPDAYTNYIVENQEKIGCSFSNI
jgi:histidinol phosphatase-like PHP family hydrolase